MKTVILILVVATMMGCAGYPAGKKYSTTELIPADAKVGVSIFTNLAADPRSQAIANSMSKFLTELYGKPVPVIENGNTIGFDYVISAGGNYICPSGSANAAGIVASAILAPVGVTVTAMAGVDANVAVAKRTLTGFVKIGSGEFHRQGSGTIVNCDKMMRAGTEYVFEQQFSAKK